MTNLKTLRLKKEYTQTLLAQFMQVGTSVVARWELGQTSPTPAQIVKLCCILGCKAKELFADEDFFTENGIPLFDENGNCISFTASCCSADRYGRSDFAVVLGADISPQLKAGDICCFSTAHKPESSSVVLCTEDGYSSRIALYRDCAEAETVLAVCTAVHCTI